MTKNNRAKEENEIVEFDVVCGINGKSFSVLLQLQASGDKQATKIVHVSVDMLLPHTAFF